MTANKALDDYMSGLIPRERIAKARDLRDIGGVPPYVLSNWRRGRVKIPIAWQRKISEIVGTDVFANVDNEIK